MSEVIKHGRHKFGLVLALSAAAQFAANGDVPWRYDASGRTIVAPMGVSSAEFSALELRTHTWNNDSYIAPPGFVTICR